MIAIHTHIEQNSRDCDGEYDNNRIAPRRLAIWELPSTHDGNGEYSLTFELPDNDALDNDDNEVLYILDATCPTDEGYQHIRAWECQDERCDLGVTLHRDHTAEKAGY